MSFFDPPETNSHEPDLSDGDRSMSLPTPTLCISVPVPVPVSRVHTVATLSAETTSKLPASRMLEELLRVLGKVKEGVTIKVCPLPSDPIVISDQRPTNQTTPNEYLIKCSCTVDGELVRFDCEIVNVVRLRPTNYIASLYISVSLCVLMAV